VRLQKARPAQAPYSEVKLSREAAKPRREQHVFCLLRVSAPSREAIFRNFVITKQQTEVSQVRLRFDVEYENSTPSLMTIWFSLRTLQQSDSLNRSVLL
jgi:hypothetical protein